MLRRLVPLGFGFGIALAAGCGGGAAGPIASPATYDPDKSADAALAECDTNKDGSLAGAELDACPGIKAAAGRIDANRDKKLSRDELKARFATYADAGFGASGVTVRVLLNGTPVAGATLTLTPETCLGGTVPGGKGTSDDTGVVSLTRDDGVPGMSPGVYRIAVAGGGVPAAYATRPLLGCEVVGSGRGDDSIDLNLVSKPK